MAYTGYHYSKINWKNKSESLTTPLGKRNMNHMDDGIYNIAENLNIVYNEVSTGKFDKADADKVIVGMPTWNSNTGILKFKFYDGTEFSVDFNIEKIPVSFSMNSAGVITMITSDGTEWTADIGDIIPTYTYVDSNTISFSDTKTGDYGHRISAQIKKNSITGEYLQPDYLSNVTTQAASASASATQAGSYADNAANDAKMAQSYAVGGSGIRQGEDKDNAKVSKEAAEKAASDAQKALETMQDVQVTGVKGNSETSYRKGNVNITKANIGLGNVGNFKAVSTSASQGLSETEKANARENIGSPKGTGDVGTATKPIYLADGTIHECTYTLGKSVPSNAVFTDTDTKNTAGATTTTEKRYLVGTSSTGVASAQTYVNASCYMWGGYLYSNGKKVDVSQINSDMSESGRTHTYLCKFTKTTWENLHTAVDWTTYKYIYAMIVGYNQVLYTFFVPIPLFLDISSTQAINSNGGWRVGYDEQISGHTGQLVIYDNTHLMGKINNAEYPMYVYAIK